MSEQAGSAAPEHHEQSTRRGVGHATWRGSFDGAGGVRQIADEILAILSDHFLKRETIGWRHSGNTSGAASAPWPIAADITGDSHWHAVYWEHRAGDGGSIDCLLTSPDLLDEASWVACQTARVLSVLPRTEADTH